MNTTKAKNHAAPGAEPDTSTPATPATPSAGAPAQPQAQAAPAAADAGAALVPAPAPDPHQGKGGLYRLVNGQRVLVQQTQAAA